MSDTTLEDYIDREIELLKLIQDATDQRSIWHYEEELDIIRTLIQTALPLALTTSLISIILI